jgi:hypothetical protein
VAPAESGASGQVRQTSTHPLRNDGSARFGSSVVGQGDLSKAGGARLDEQEPQSVAPQPRRPPIGRGTPAWRVTDLYRENLIGCDGGFMRVPSLEPSTRQRGVFEGRDVGLERLHLQAVDGRPAHQLIRVNHVRERLQDVVPRRPHLIDNVSLPSRHSTGRRPSNFPGSVYALKVSLLAGPETR